MACRWVPDITRLIVGSNPTTPDMAKRVRIVDDSPSPADDKGGGKYFEDATEVERISSGCGLLDCSLGGGWAEGRFINIVGDSSAGKTLLAIEASANFHLKHDDGLIKYRDKENAVDPIYAASVGLPIDVVDFGDEEGEFNTVEDFERDLKAFAAKLKGRPGLYVMDSLDSLTDDAEVKRDEAEGDDRKGTFGVNKAKQMSGLFRKCVRLTKRHNLTVIIISQTRDAINVTFGEKNTRSGGRALEFYCRQIVWLAKMDKVKATKGKIERVIGVNVRANPKKNNYGAPFRDVEFPIYYSYGVDDVRAGLNWLNKVGRLDLLELGEKGDSEEEEEPKAKPKGFQKREKGPKKTKALAALFNSLDELESEEYRKLRRRVNKAVRIAWKWVEKRFQPPRRKYG